MRITPREARRGLYIDFEGRQAGPPSVLGIAAERHDNGPVEVEHVIVEEALWPAAARDGYRAEPIPTAVSALLERSRDERRLVIAWSTREINCIEEHCVLRRTLQEHLQSVYVDAKELAKAWKRRVHPQVAFPRDPRRSRYRLLYFCRLIGYDVPRYVGDQKTGRRIAELRRQLLRRNGNFDALSPSVRRHWTKLLAHNRHDCIGMREVTLRATADLSLALPEE